MGWTRAAARAWGFVAFVAVARADAYDPPAGYYASTVGLSGAALDSALHARVAGHTVRSYAQIRQDLAVTDRDPAYPAPVGQPTAITNILLFYSEGWSGYSRSGVWDGGDTWNREHTWPDSRGVGQPDQGPDFSDLHHIRAADPGANSSRNNKYFDAVGGTVAAHPAAPLARATSQAWEPPDGDKGWTARAMAYMATRYDGTESDTTDLVLVETPPDSVTNNPPQMGRKSTLLRWNRMHPPSDWERRRNQIIFERYQANRNPFIDHPEFMDMIHEAPLGRETRLTWRYRHFTLAELRDAAVSGDLADPDGDGRANLLELAQGEDPRAPGPGAALAGDTEPSVYPKFVTGAPEGRRRLVYKRLRDRELSGLNYAVETSFDLVVWSGAGALTQIASEPLGGGVVERVTVEFAATDPAVFARLRVSR